MVHMFLGAYRGMPLFEVMDLPAVVSSKARQPEL